MKGVIKKMRNIQIGDIYKHYKGNFYTIENIAYDANTSEAMIVYAELLRRNNVWVRKLNNFLEELSKEKQYYFNQVYRFEKV